MYETAKRNISNIKTDVRFSSARGVLKIEISFNH